MANDTEESSRIVRPGRPPKPNALTPAERAKRYRDKKKANGQTRKNDSTIPTAMVQLQLKYDQERMKVMLLENQLREMTRKAAAPPGPNPLAKQVTSLLTQLKKQDKIISTCNAEIARLRDEIASRK
jgi:phosphoenolpyruvate carboxylase